MKTLNLLISALLLGLVPQVQAQVFEVPPFEGSHSEGFETQAAGGMIGWQDCLIGNAFTGLLEICAPLGPHLNVTELWSFACTATPRSGEFFAGTRDGSYLLFTFILPVDRFGAYFSANAPEVGTVTVYFYDQVFQPLGQQVLDLEADCEWRWNGWESQGGPIYFMEVVHDIYGGGRVLIDDMTLNIADDTVGVRYCDALPNSTGQIATMTASGTTSVALNNLSLQVDSVPANAPSIVFYGPASTSVPFGGGTLCVNDNQVGIQRLATPPASAFGQVDITVDNSTTDFLRLVPGSTWYFQTWFSDLGSSAGNGLSDALELTFVP